MPRKLFSYNRFIGLDSVTSPSNMSERFLTELKGGYVDFRGQILRGPILEYALDQSASPKHFIDEEHYNIKHYGANDFCRYIFDRPIGNPQVGVNILSDSVTQTSAFSQSNAAISPISLVNFDQKQFAFMSGHDPYYYNGTAFTNAATGSSNQYSSLASYPKGGMAVNILNRLVVAGIPGRETEIHISVQDSFEDWRTNTSSGTTPNQTDGAIIDVKNQFTSNDTIQGLAVLEGDKLVVFGQNETLVYLADTNINLWEIARDFRVPIGLFGRNTAVNVGTDVFFCSRFGIHSLKRAASGLTLETKTFTREIRTLYQGLIENVPTKTGGYSNIIFSEPHAVWDGGIGQYRVFIPQNNTGTSHREIRFTYDPDAGRSGHLSFATSGTGNSDADITCGSYFAKEDLGIGHFPPASLLVGARNGFGNGRAFDGTPIPAATATSVPDGSSAAFYVRTPLLSQGSPDTYKHYKRLIIRAVGTTDFRVKIYNSENNVLQNTLVRPESATFSTTTGISGDGTRPIDLPIPHRSKSISISFETGSENEGTSSTSGATGFGTLKILDFALVIDTK